MLLCVPHTPKTMGPTIHAQEIGKAWSVVDLPLRPPLVDVRHIWAMDLPNWAVGLAYMI